MITLRGVEVTADAADDRSATLLAGITLHLAAKTTAVIGENGSGKSTLARVIAGLRTPARGTVSAPRPAGMLFANPAAQTIMPTVREDVALSFRGAAKDAVPQLVDAALAEHDLTALADRHCFTLSSGQQQRLAVCALLAARPALVVADEPTSLLDARHTRLVTQRLFAAEAPPLVLLTHDLALAERCEEAVWVDAGRVAAHGPAADVVADYRASVA